MARVSRDLGVRFLTGALGGAQSPRAARIREILSTVIGPGGPSAPSLPIPGDASPHRLHLLRGAPRAREAAGRAALQVLEAVLTREFARIEPLAHRRIFMFWPDGTIANHDTRALIKALAARQGRPAPALPEATRVYTAGELRSIVARGVAESIDRAIDIQNAMAVTVMLAGRARTQSSIIMMMSPDDRGTWRAHNLILPGVDDAHRASAPPSPNEDESVRIADRVIRHFMLGHDRHLRALRNHFFDRVLVADEVHPSEELAAMAGRGDNRFESADCAFDEPVLMTSQQIDASRGAKVLRERLTKKARSTFGRKIERFDFSIVEAKYATLDFARGMIDPRAAYIGLLRPRLSAPNTARFRVAAIEVAL